MEIFRIDLLNVCYAYGVFLLAYLANILFSLYYNIKVNGEDFNKYTLWNSIKKAVVFVLATFMLIVALDSAMLYFAEYIPELNESIQNAVSVLMVITTIGRAALKYIVEAYSTFSNILNGKSSENLTALDRKE